MRNGRVNDVIFRASKIAARKPCRALLPAALLDRRREPPAPRAPLSLAWAQGHVKRKKKRRGKLNHFLDP